jgi:hypothetical protein
MSNVRPTPPGRVPTLTEVVRMPEQAAAVEATAVPQAAAPSAAPVTVQSAPQPQPQGATVPGATPSPALQEDELVERVLAELQRQLDLMLEVRMREVLTPVLTRTADAMLRDARNELASTLRDVVARVVSQELSRHRGR